MGEWLWISRGRMASSHFCVMQFPRKVLHKQQGVYCILVRDEHGDSRYEFGLSSLWVDSNTSGVQERFSLSKWFVGAVWNTSLSHYRKASSNDLPTAVKVSWMLWLFRSLVSLHLSSVFMCYEHAITLRRPLNISSVLFTVNNEYLAVICQKGPLSSICLLVTEAV